MDFPQLSMTLPDGREESIMKRTTLVCLTALSPLTHGTATHPGCSPPELRRRTRCGGFNLFIESFKARKAFPRQSAVLA